MISESMFLGVLAPCLGALCTMFWWMWQTTFQTLKQHASELSILKSSLERGEERDKSLQATFDSLRDAIEALNSRIDQLLLGKKIQ